MQLQEGEEVEYTRFGEEMRVLRTRRHQTQQDMADILGVTKAFYHPLKQEEDPSPKAGSISFPTIIISNLILGNCWRMLPGHPEILSGSF